MTERLALHPIQRPSTLLARVATPGSLEVALALLAEHGPRAKPLAGGTDLMVEVDRSEHGDVEVFVDLTRLDGLGEISESGGRITIGALATHAECAASPLLQRLALPLAQACLEVGSPQLRNRATVAGNLVTASPANDTISALAVLNAELTLVSQGGSRTVALSAFHLGVRKTVLEPDELVTAISFDALDDTWRSVYVKLGLRRSQAISVVHLAVACRFDGGINAPVTEARLSLGSVAPTIVRIDDAEAALVGHNLTEERIVNAAELAANAVSPIDDLRSSARYRSSLVGEMVRRALHAVASDTTRTTIPANPVVLGDAGPWPTGDRFSAEHALGDPIVAEVNGETIDGPFGGGTLLAWLRHRGLSGTKEGCAEGECGACTVHLDDRAVLSCLIPETRAHGATVVTIEGLAEHHHELQDAFVDAGGVQCGYCIPGFLMSAAKLLDDYPSTDSPVMREGAIKAALAGNLCRCTGYYKIEDALRAQIESRMSVSSFEHEGGTR